MEAQSLSVFFSTAWQKLCAWAKGIGDALAGRHGFTLQRRTRIAVALVLLAVLAVVLVNTVRAIHGVAELRVQPDHPLFDAVMSARISAWRWWTVLGLKAQSVLEAYAVFVLLDRTVLGKRLWHWSAASDSEGSSAAKTLVAGLTFLVLFAVFAHLNGRVLP